MSESEIKFTGYEVRDTRTGEIIKGCFVMRPTEDNAARVALGTYAYATHNMAMKRKILAFLEKIQNDRFAQRHAKTKTAGRGDGSA